MSSRSTSYDAFFLVLLGTLYKQGFVQEKFVPSNKGWYIFYGPTIEPVTKIHIINYFWSNQKPITKGQQHLVSKPQSGHTFIPWLWSVYLRSSAFKAPFSQQRSKVNEILSTSTICKFLEFCLKCQHALEREAGQSPERCQVSGKRIWFRVKGMVIWQ